MRNYLLYFLLAMAIVIFIGMSVVYKSEAHRFFGIANSDAVEINYPYSYRVDKLYVKDGQTIQKGDKLARLVRNDLMLEKKITTNQLAENQSEEQLKINQLKAQIKKLELENKINRDTLSYKISALEKKNQVNQELLASISGENRSEGSPPSLIQLQQLKSERKNVMALYRGQRKSLNKELSDQMNLFHQRKNRLGTELQGMKREEKALDVVAPFNGIVATIHHRVHEEVEAFEPLMVLNSAKPTYVKGYISIENMAQVEVGKKVYIGPLTGLDRNTKVEGVIESLSANILPYPSRLKRYKNVEMWGIEVIISVPKNHFILGEKILVLNDENVSSRSEGLISYFYQAQK